MPGLARDGDPMSHGGTVSATQSSVKCNGIPVVRMDDPYDCPVHGSQVMTEASATLSAEGKKVCRVGDAAGCGATVASGSTDTFNET